MRMSGEPVRPSSLAGSIADLIVANLDHGRRQAARVGMALDRIVDLVARRIWRVDANGERRVGLKPADKNIGQAAIVAEHDSNLPRARLSEIDRSIGVDRDERGRLPPGQAAPEACIDRGMVGSVDLVEPPCALRLGEPRLAGTGRPRSR